MEQYQLDQYKEQLSDVLPTYRRLGMEGIDYIPNEQFEIYNDLVKMHNHFIDTIVANTFNAVESAYALGYKTKDVIIQHIVTKQLDKTLSERPGATRFRGDPVEELALVVQKLMDGDSDICEDAIDIFVDSVEQVFDMEERRVD
jgi:hypothetical protein